MRLVLLYRYPIGLPKYGLSYYLAWHSFQEEARIVLCPKPLISLVHIKHLNDIMFILNQWGRASNTMQVNELKDGSENMLQ